MPRGGRGSHSTSVPIPLTQSALDARKSFYCELCGKGYSRMNEFEAHESSYDHQHKKRFMEMKQMQKGASSVEARRERERRAEEKAGLITIKPIKLGSGPSGEGDDAPGTAGKKGFKSAFGTIEIASQPGSSKPKQGGFRKAFPSTDDSASPVKNAADIDNPDPDGLLESDTEDEGYERYNPAKPTL